MNGSLKRRHVFLTALAISSASLAALWITGLASTPDFLKSRDGKFISACEDTLKKRLKAPSTYRRLSDPHIAESVATLDDYKGWTDNPEKKASDQDRQARNPKLAEMQAAQTRRFLLDEHTLKRAIIEYEAANSYGTPIRGYALCTFADPSPESFSDFDRQNVMIDGRTAFEWSLGE
ncbi:hypothetical protein GCM10011415_28300 [Salipiger pallidus]|uniref:Uncharacterized protein n=1 Tax=Salipiger pallidus TaxID=1775170 RepID=A0A8J2ZL20_9RHOB|nr:hypothetical protein [Salipiger pallidus]GGG77714.1 hypothetical protein GCM10011415_28300 [Salipiger pallidus]